MLKTYRANSHKIKTIRKGKNEKVHYFFNCSVCLC